MPIASAAVKSPCEDNRNLRAKTTGLLSRPKSSKKVQSNAQHPTETHPRTDNRDPFASGAGTLFERCNSVGSDEMAALFFWVEFTWEHHACTLQLKVANAPVRITKDGVKLPWGYPWKMFSGSIANFELPLVLCPQLPLVLFCLLRISAKDGPSP